MNLSITLNDVSLTEAADVVSALQKIGYATDVNTNENTGVVAVNVTPTTKRRGRPPAGAASSPAPAPAPPPSLPEDDGLGLGDEPPAKVCTREDVRAALVNLKNAKGSAAARGVLTDLGAEKIADLKDENFAKAIAKAEALSK